MRAGGIAVSGAVWMAIWAAPAPAGDALPASATLRVGVPAGPDAVAGFDRSLWAEAARDAGLGVVFEVMAPDAAPAALDAGRIDVAAGPYPPDGGAAHAPPVPLARLVPVAGDGDALLKRRGDGSVGSSDRAAGKVLGVLGPASGSAGASAAGGAEARLRAEAAALGARVAPPARAFADPLRDLAAGRVAALAGALSDVAAAALARPDRFEAVGPTFGRGRPLAALVRADRPELAGRLDAALGRMRDDGRLAGTQRRWFGLAFDPALPAAGSQPAAVPSATSATSATSKP